MHRYSLSCSAEAGDLEPVVLAVHELIHRLPVTAKSVEKMAYGLKTGELLIGTMLVPFFLKQLQKIF